MQSNTPLDILQKNQPEACTIIIFGATGDLTHRKIIPALYNLKFNNDLPDGTNIIGFARRDKTDEIFRKGLKDINSKISKDTHDERLWEGFSKNITYHKSDFNDLEGYHSLKENLEKMENEGCSCNRLFYLASAPEFFDDILLHIKQSSLNKSTKGWNRVVIEKPFGKDFKTALHLNEIVNNTFLEKDTFRIDHYLGKETAQNIMVLRFSNIIFESLWNNRFIDHIQISCAEPLGMEGGRGAYFDSSGALRDMVQNHLLQLLSLITMEHPVDLSADGVRDEKVKVLKSLRKFKSNEEVYENVIRAQYESGYIDEELVLAYTKEDRVNPNSKTETYVALKIMIDNWRWKGVPIYVRMGKRLPKKDTRISIHYKDSPNVLFNATKQAKSIQGNTLTIRIQPDEGMSLNIRSKVAGQTSVLEKVKLDFSYSHDHDSYHKNRQEAYERLLLDALSGDATLFARKDEVETAWKYIDIIEEAWHSSPSNPHMAKYNAGTWGPKEADDLINKSGRSWLKDKS